MVEFLKNNILLLIAMLIAFFAIFVFNSTNVEGISMENTLHNQDKLITEIFTKKYERKDVVILFADNKGQGFLVPNLFNTLYQVSQKNRMIYVKRIIGLPGESVEVRNKEVIIYNKENPNGQVLQEDYAKNDWICTTNGVESKSGNATDFIKTTVPQGSYFVMGDNRGCSKDSRIIGPINKESILGRVMLKFRRDF
jgi:signal peptidase I